MATASGCGCGCGGASCLTEASGGYVRPRFFAGQLLTEDDLQLITDYVAAKNRLHNRDFLGEGVVCGLEVLCHPCESGEVRVRPGHALDCCGNDIVVPCEQVLDINSMVHELRVKTLGGYDCGDPCASQGASAPVVAGASATSTTGGDTTGTTTTTTTATSTARRYSLYVDYCEEPADPVAPYATDEPCGPTACEPSRIREGYRFELRCEAPKAKPDDVYTRIAACLSGIPTQKGWGARGRMWEMLAGPIPTALSTFRGTTKLDFRQDDADAMTTTLERLRKTTAGGVKAAQGQKGPDVGALRGGLDDLRTLVMSAARLNSLPEADREQAMKQFGLENAVREASKVAQTAAAWAQPHIDDATDDPYERRLAQALTTDGPGYTDPGLAQEERDSVLNQLAVQGVPMNAELLRYQEETLADMKAWLLQRLDCSASATDCGLRNDVAQIDVESSGTTGTVTAERVAASQTGAQGLAAAMLRYVLMCACLAVLPPCPTCDDTAVLLATVEVDECVVTQICNLDRRIPLTGRALAHWLPAQEFALLVDFICCQLPRRFRKGLAPPPGPLVVPRGGGRPAEGPDTTAIPVAMREAPATIFTHRAGDVADTIAPVESFLATGGVPSSVTQALTRAAAALGQIHLPDLIATALPRPAQILPVTQVTQLLQSETMAPVVSAAVRQAAADAFSAPAQTAAAEAAANAAAAAIERAAGRRLTRMEQKVDEIASLKREMTRLKQQLAQQRQGG